MSERDDLTEQRFHIPAVPDRQNPEPLARLAWEADLLEAEPDPGPICCRGECCGGGSYCCGHPDNIHTHSEEEDQ